MATGVTINYSDEQQQQVHAKAKWQIKYNSSHHVLIVSVMLVYFLFLLASPRIIAIWYRENVPIIWYSNKPHTID